MDKTQTPNQSVEYGVEQSPMSLEDRLNQLEQYVAAHDQYLGQKIQEDKERDMNQQFADSLQNTDIPDMKDAANYLASKHTEEASKYGMNEDKVKQAIDNTFFTLAKEAINNGLDPAKTIYQYAVSQGYTPTEAKEKVEDTLGGDKKDHDKDRDYTDAVQASINPKSNSSVNGFDENQAMAAFKTDPNRLASMLRA